MSLLCIFSKCNNTNQNEGMTGACWFHIIHVWNYEKQSRISLYYDSHSASRRLKSRKLQASRVMRWWLSRLSSRFGAKSSREPKPKWLPGLRWTVSLSFWKWEIKNKFDRKKWPSKSRSWQEFLGDQFLNDWSIARRKWQTLCTIAIRNCEDL